MTFSRFFVYFKHFDWILFTVTLLLIIFGLAAIYSLTLNQEVPSFLKFKKQIIFSLIGLLLVFGISSLNYRFFETYAYLFYILVLVLLLSLLVFGPKIRGATSWFAMGPFSFQPAEVTKIVMVIVLAKFFKKYASRAKHPFYLFLSGALVSGPTILIASQPDLGSALVLVLIWGAMLVLAGIKPLHLLILILLALLIILSFWLFILRDYQKERLETFLFPSRDPLGQGYNVSQSVIAVGSGKFFGRGLGLGPQSRLNFLPEQETDFIFAVIAEELGFIGSFLLIGIFATLLYRIIKIALEASDDFSIFLASGFALLFFIQAFINISMNMGILPITGIPLPFVSYGGSSLISNLVALGILESIAVRS